MRRSIDLTPPVRATQDIDQPPESEQADPEASQASSAGSRKRKLAEASPTERSRAHSEDEVRARPCTHRVGGLETHLGHSALSGAYLGGRPGVEQPPLPRLRETRRTNHTRRRTRQPREPTPA